MESKPPIICTDPITKGTFSLLWHDVLLDYDEEDGEIKNTRATGSILIEGWNNPLFDVIKEHPLRIQGLVASGMFGIEKKCIKIERLTDFGIIDDGIVKEIELSLIFEIMDNLKYLEQLVEYKDNNNL